MRFDLHLRDTVKRQIEAAAQEMAAWGGQPDLKKKVRDAIRDRIVFFDHATKRENLRVGGVDGSGDFPSLAYADSAVYFSVAQGVIYESSAESGLRELPVLSEPVIHVTWIPEDESKRTEVLHAAFERLAGHPVRAVIEESDYRKIRAALGAKPTGVQELLDGLVLPHPTDTGNLAIQLRSSAELGAALRLICSDQKPTCVLVDTTLSLPLIGQSGSLFFEHLKRLCCIEATSRGIGFFAVSKSHGLPSLEVIETIAQEKAGLAGSRSAEHWFLRLPIPGVDQWGYALPAGKRVPPHGAVSYLFRLHRSTPVMRLDMDYNYWKAHLSAKKAEKAAAREQAIFQDLDYAGHDQRAFGYPYPIKACHDRTSMTRAERVALRKQIVDAAVAAGMKRSLFRDVSVATGHA
jgi:hypothetical protein